MSARLEDLGKSFARHLRAEGKAQRTITIYLQSVRYLSAWLEAQGRPATLDNLNRAAIREWLGTLTDQGLEGSTRRTRYKGMHRFCGWLVDEGELDKHPMAGLAVPEIDERPVPIVDDETLRKLIKACQGKDFDSRRDEAMIRFLVDCGVRISELCGLLLDRLDLDAETAIIRGKGGKERAVYFGARTARALDRYLRLRSQHRWAHLPEVFLTQRGALSTDGARYRLETLADRAGVPRLHPHQFRHTNAHDWLVSGGQERDLKRLMGWSSDVMLEKYGRSAADARARLAAQRMRRGDRI